MKYDFYRFAKKLVKYIKFQMSFPWLEHRYKECN